MKGSVFKRCTRCGNRVKQRTCTKCRGSSFKWAFLLWIGKDADGKWMRRSRGGFATKADTERELQETLTALRGGTFVQSSMTTLSSYLLDEWLPATAPPQVKYETWNDRRRNLTAHVVPRIGGIELQELNAAHLNRLYADLLRGGRVDGAGGLSPTSVVRIHAMLRKALNDAVRWGRVQRNVATLADPPPGKAVRAARRRSMRTWTASQLRRFLEATAGDDLHHAWTFAANTGLRRSELLGLRWPDLDLNAATVTVRQTVLDSEGGYQLDEDQKTTLSARTLHLDLRIAAMLREHRRDQNAARLLTGDAWQDHGLVFCRADGSWWNPPAISLAFLRAVRRTDVPRIRLHDLRHTHATLLLAVGVNPKVVSERLGHSSVAFTLDTYAHVMPGMQPEAAKLFMDLVLASGDDEEDAREAGA